MKQVLLGILVVAFAVVLLGAARAPSPRGPAVSSSASGEGTIAFGKDGHGVGFLSFAVEQDAETTGSLLFAAEENHRYPDIIVRMASIDKAVFSERSVDISGSGMLHDDPVSVTASAFDGAGTEKPDTFSIQCTTRRGKVVFEAKGALSIGDIVVGEVD